MALASGDTGSDSGPVQAETGASGDNSAEPAALHGQPAPGDGAPGSRNKGSGLSADAPVFVPSFQAAADESDVVARLPPAHRRLLRQAFQAQTGEWVSYYVGRLKSFNNQTGYGFLECAQSKLDYGVDVFVHKNFVPNPWHIGQPVEFAVRVNNRGQPQADDVLWLPRLPDAAKVLPRAPAAGVPAPTAAADSAASAPAPACQEASSPAVSATAAADGSGTGTASGSAPARAGAGIVVARAEKPQEPRRLGTLKSYSPAQGYGFLHCRELQEKHNRDTYFDKSELPQEGWLLGMFVEFTCVFNARGQPQARLINWNPIPYASDPEHPAPGGRVAGGISDATQEKLRKLLKFLHDDKDRETAVVTAIDLQGGSAAMQQVPPSEQDPPELPVDYVSFVLDRLAPADDTGAIANTAQSLKDFVKMLLLLMIARMLRNQPRLQRCEQFIRWFEALAQTMDKLNDTVKDHLPDVLVQIQGHIKRALEENVVLNDEALSTRIQRSVEILQVSEPSKSDGT